MLLLLAIACTVEKATIPSYVYIKKFKVITDPLIQGDTTQDIVDVWLYQNQEFKGSFGLPTYIPLIEKDKKNLTLRAGVKRSGQDDQRLQYPMFTDFDTIITLGNLRSDTIAPVVSYLPNCKFPLVQDFDGNSSFFSIYEPKNGDSIAKINDGDAWKINNNSAKFIMGDSTYELFYISKVLTFPIQPGVNIYMELDYKCSDQFIVGLSAIYINGESKDYSVYTANSSNGKWKKLYLDMATEVGSEIAQHGSTTKFQVFFRVAKNGNPLTDNTHLFIDNVKLIHF